MADIVERKAPPSVEEGRKSLDQCASDFFRAYTDGHKNATMSTLQEEVVQMLTDHGSSYVMDVFHKEADHSSIFGWNIKANPHRPTLIIDHGSDEILIDVDPFNNVLTTFKAYKVNFGSCTTGPITSGKHECTFNYPKLHRLVLTQSDH
jgi:hypothetical protein